MCCRTCNHQYEYEQQRYPRVHGYIPKGITDNEESNILLACIAQDFIAFGLYHVSIGKYQLFAVKYFLVDIYESSRDLINVVHSPTSPFAP